MKCDILGWKTFGYDSMQIQRKKLETINYHYGHDKSLFLSFSLSLSLSLIVSVLLMFSEIPKKYMIYIVALVGVGRY